ncbi:hypothetical protein Sjap_000595 [Stephania japonica]|uniref:Uncharacterized protein n=1 Tax=Stephania japonica TaxID=461633 RepID=A0AAP0PSK8_9MAGN
MAKEKGLTKVVIETNSLELVSLMDPRHTLVFMDYQIEEIQRTLHQMKGIYIRYIPRCINACANFLVKNALGLQYGAHTLDIGLIVFPLVSTR